VDVAVGRIGGGVLSIFGGFKTERGVGTGLVFLVCTGEPPGTGSMGDKNCGSSSGCFRGVEGDRKTGETGGRWCGLSVRWTDLSACEDSDLCSTI
jgi:hypothetical protein